jgi:hypothetical protein
METKPRYYEPPKILQDGLAKALRSHIECMVATASAATPGPWRSTWDDPDRPESCIDRDQVTVQSMNKDLGGEEEFARSVVALIWYDGENVSCRKKDAAHIATFSPDVAVALLALADAAITSRTALPVYERSTFVRGAVDSEEARAHALNVAIDNLTAVLSDRETSGYDSWKEGLQAEQDVGAQKARHACASRLREILSSVSLSFQDRLLFEQAASEWEKVSR